MITKERLEELIKEGASVYHEFKGDIFKIDLSKIKKYAEIAFEYYNEYYKCGITLTISDLYETKEDAEFALKYQNITRTETLSLPTWEEFEKNPFFAFISKSGKNVVIEHTLVVSLSEQKILKKDETSKTVLGVYYVDYFVDRWENLIQLELTKANYLKACELCRKLFLGEEE